MMTHSRFPMLRTCPHGAQAALFALAGLLSTGLATAQVSNYPDKPVRLILSVPAGGTLDNLGRVIGEKLSIEWKQPVIVEPKPGAAGMLAASMVAKAPPDGYTVLLSLASVVQNTVVRASTAYLLRDLTPVSLVASMPVVIVVRQEHPAKTLQDLVRMSKDAKERVSFASWGTGSTGHIIGEALKQQSGGEMTHVAYKGEAEPFADLIGGRVTAATGSPGFYLNHLQKVRILAVGAEKRLRSIPDVPTFEEAGYPTANLSGWGGFFVPAATPPTITTKLSLAIQKIVAMPEISERIRSLEYEPVGNSSEDFALFISRDLTKWNAVVKQGKIVIE